MIMMSICEHLENGEQNQAVIAKFSLGETEA
jgi:hypothetical protein